MADLKFKNKIRAQAGVILSAETTERALLIDASGEVKSSSVTSTELGRLSGVTSGIQTQLNSKIDTSLIGANNGVASLDGTGKVPSAQLPSYVDDVLEFNNLAAFPVTGENNKIYVALDTNKCYRWSGSTYIEISPSEVVSVNGQIGIVVLSKSDVELSNVDNTSDLNKPISSATQTALNGKANTSHTHALTDLTQSSATNGQVPTWNGTNWAAATPAAVITDHTLLSNIGTNTHAQIDTHISSASNVHGIGAGNSVVGTGTTQTITNKTIDADLNTITNIENADIKAGAAIARNKLASGTANHIVINDGTGVMSSEAILATSRGGLGTSGAAFTGVVKAASGVFSAATIVDADVSASAAVARTKLANGTANRLVVNNVSGGMSDAAAITAARALISDANGIPAHSTVTSTELGHLSGVTSAIQTQINARALQTELDLAEQAITDLQTLSGVAANATTLGTFTGTTIPDSSTVKAALQSLETKVETIQVGSANDIQETSFVLANNAVTPTNITGFLAAAAVRGFSALVTVEIDATLDRFETFEFIGIRKASGFEMSQSAVGDESGVVFSITSGGQVQYTSASYAGFVSGRIRFRMITTSV